MLSIKQILLENSRKLDQISDTPRLDTELIMMSVLGLESYQLITNESALVSEEHQALIDEKIKRRQSGEPIAYILGYKHFMNLVFEVKAGVLIPRPDTEILVESILNAYKGLSFKGLEVGSGSGAISISLLKYSDKSQMTALDISEIAIEISTQNAYSNEVKNRLTIRYSDVFSGLEGRERFDFIVSNPPYIPHGDIELLMKDVKDFEPHLALDGGSDGLDFYRRITEEAPEYLNPSGGLYFEIGYDQGQAVSDLLVKRGFTEVHIIKDLAGHDRVVCGKWKV